MSAPLGDGGPAFPISRAHFTPEGKLLNVDWMPGMSLRDYFAGQFLAGVANNADLDSLGKPECAAHAYSMADAMLAARQEKP